MSDVRRPRGGQLWRRTTDAKTVRVIHRRKCPAPGSSDNFWSMVLWHAVDDDSFGVPHEADFVSGFEYVGSSRVTGSNE